MKPVQRSWLSLLGFCAVSGMIVALGFAVLLAGASLAFAVSQRAPGADAGTMIGASEERISAEQTVEQPAAAQSAAAAQPVDDSGTTSGQTFSGMITDSRCGARHRMNSGKTPAECARSCVRHGAHYVLVDGDKVYALEGDPAELEKPAGERVNIAGKLEGDTIKVKAVVTE
ncbi:MAG: hypothetical protein WA637_08670 [Terriglobales bacterium]